MHSFLMIYFKIDPYCTRQFFVSFISVHLFHARHICSVYRFVKWRICAWDCAFFIREKTSQFRYYRCFLIYQHRSEEVGQASRKASWVRVHNFTRAHINLLTVMERTSLTKQLIWNYSKGMRANLLFSPIESAVSVAFNIIYLSERIVIIFSMLKRLLFPVA